MILTLIWTWWWYGNDFFKSQFCSWFFSKWEYFKCAADESCCGNAWNRYCCIKNNASDNNGFLTDDPDIWAIIITFGIITISISLLFFGLYIAKRNRSVHYVKLTDFWQSYVVKTPVIVRIKNNKNIVGQTKVSFFWDSSQEMSSSGFLPKKQATNW